MALPTEKNKPGQKFTALVYGPPKIGKSTFCSGADDSIFVSTEPGLNFLPVVEQPCATWEQCLSAFGDIAKGGHNFGTVVIDTIDNLAKMCSVKVLADFGVSHESDLPYGKGWAAVTAEMMRVLAKVSMLPYNLILISHAKEKEITPRGRQSYTVIAPSLPNAMKDQIMALVDCILYVDFEQIEGDSTSQPRRVIRTASTDMYEAGDRTGRLAPTMPLDYAAFIAAIKGGK